MSIPNITVNKFFNWFPASQAACGLILFQFVMQNNLQRLQLLNQVGLLLSDPAAVGQAEVKASGDAFKDI